MNCTHCGDPFPLLNCEHNGLCCDCFDLSWGMPLEDINEERAAQGKEPIRKPWVRSGAV